ncbi:hypothetical protein BDY24DRAFT_186986 [Mrakia frigida]|uniref:uncharacterized protein n=1 Tax=Mrakia frigida TaxID=29902 RepID=UPI003FCC05AA
MSANDTSPSLFPSLSAITELNSALAPPLPAVVAPAPSSVDDAYGPPPPASSSTLPPSVDYSTRAPSLQPSNHSNSNPSPVRTTQHPDDILQSQREGSETIFREKLIPTSKVYVGGLPEDTLHSDMEACFSKSGKILNIELKSGYGFVEFEHKFEADNAVETYHDGYFMGSQIKVEHSRGGGKTAKFQSEPGCCFKCGKPDHWAKECTNTVIPVEGSSVPARSPTPSSSNRRLSASFRDAPPQRQPPLPPVVRDAPPPPSFRDAPPPRSGPIGGGGGGYRNDGYRPPPSSPPRSNNNRGGYGPPSSFNNNNNNNNNRAPYDSYNDRPPPSAAFPAPGLNRDGPLPPRNNDYYPPHPISSGPPPPPSSRDYYPSHNGNNNSNGASFPPPNGRYDDRRDFRAPQQQPPLPPQGRYNDDRDRMPSYRDEPPRRDFYGSGPPPPPLNGGGGGYGSSSSSYGAPPPPSRQDDYYGGGPPRGGNGGGYGGPPAPYGREPDRYNNNGGGRGPIGGGRPMSPPIGRYGAPGGDRDQPPPSNFGGGGGGGGGWNVDRGRRPPSPPRGRGDFDSARFVLLL